MKQSLLFCPASASTFLWRNTNKILSRKSPHSPYPVIFRCQRAIDVDLFIRMPTARCLPLRLSGSGGHILFAAPLSHLPPYSLLFIRLVTHTAFHNPSTSCQIRISPHSWVPSITLIARRRSLLLQHITDWLIFLIGFLSPYHNFSPSALLS